MAADQDRRTTRSGATGTDTAEPPQGSGPVRRERRPATEPPPQAVMGLLNYLTATSLDEDYAHVSRNRPARVGRRARPGTVGLVVLAVFGALIATAGVQTSRTADESALSRASLVSQVNARRAGLTARQQQIAALTKDIATLTDSQLDATNRGRAIAARLDRLELPTGAVAATGPGVRVVVDDAPGATQDKQTVLDQDLQKLANGLWLVGAEAMSINGQRLTNLTAIRQAGGAITVNLVSLRRPYTILAIGDRDQMAARLLETNGGRVWLTLRASFGMKFDIESEESMTVPAARQLVLRHAREPERGP